jgi:hypothetical protein
MRGTDGRTTHIMNAGLVPLAARTPALVAAAGARASYRFFEFFTAQIRNPNTRRAYARAGGEQKRWGYRERACNGLGAGFEIVFETASAQASLASAISFVSGAAARTAASRAASPSPRV